MPAPAKNKELAGNFIDSQLGTQHRHSLPDDMDFFVIDRRDILDTPIADLMTASEGSHTPSEHEWMADGSST